MRAGHPLAHLRRCSVRQLASFAWIAPLRGSPLRAHFEALFSAAALPMPTTTIECNSLLVARPHPRARVIRRIGVTERRDWRPTAAQGKLLEILRRQSQSWEVGAHSGTTAGPVKRRP